jgi:hypothetical protein
MTWDSRLSTRGLTTKVNSENIFTGDSMRIVRTIGSILLMLSTLLVGGIANASTPAPGIGCKSNDTELGHIYAPFVGDDNGSYAEARLCRDHITTGWYFNVFVEDTKSDGKCAHAEAVWVKPDYTEDDDYGMYTCGGYAYFYTPVRNWTRYYYLYINAFVDNGLSLSSDILYTADLPH